MSLFSLSQAVLVAALQVAAPESTPADSIPIALTQDQEDAELQPVARRPAARTGRWHLQGGVSLRHDDNILFLSKGSGMSSQTFRITSVDDRILSPWAELRAPLGRSELGASARFNAYATNAIKNYQVFSLFLDRQRGKTSALRLAYRMLFDGYAGELTDPDTGSPASAFYDVHEVEVRYTRRTSRGVTIAPRQTLKMRVYSGSLDNARSRAGAETSFPLYVRTAPWLRLDFEGNVEYLRALKPRDDFDPSSLRYFVEAGAFVEPVGTTLELSPSVRYGQRRFTTSKPSDTTFHGRTDSQYQLQVTARYHFSRAFSLYGAYARDGAHAGVANVQDEDTSFTRNVASAGLTLRY